ncbi:MAG: hypothetical protein HY712_05695 [candidate division NC10 bacterium]|nr:hypothetical protein [candidate division NC10 bacterium]
MLLILLLVLIGIGVFSLLMAPFLWGSHQDALEIAPSASVDLLARKEAALSALKELEFDYGTRKLSREDYEELRAVYRVEAAEILELMDRGGNPSRDLDTLIDAEVAAWRTRRATEKGAVHGAA